jgi:hypothetical protein
LERGIAASTAAASPLGIMIAITLASQTGVVRGTEKYTKIKRITNNARTIAPPIIKESALDNLMESPT